MIIVLGGFTVLVVSTLPAGGAQEAARPDRRIENIIVIVQQNHTFDSYFGTYPGAAGYSEVDRFPLAADGVTRLSPILYDDSLLQAARLAHPGIDLLSNGTPAAEEAFNGGLMDGFAVAQESRDRADELVMLHHDGSTAPGMWALADQYVLFDRFHSSVMGGTLANMLHLIAGDAGLLTRESKVNLAALHDSEIVTVFDQLTEAGLSWNFYAGRKDRVNGEAVLDGTYLAPDTVTPSILYWAPVFAMRRFWTDPGLTGRLSDQEEFYEDAASGNLPSLSFVLPRPTDHVPSSIRASEGRLLSLINAVAKSPQWERTAVFVVWDDWGGFYDHAAPPPDYGFRLPAMLISPWAKEGYVSHTLADHTSVLAFIGDNFDLPPLSERQENAARLIDAFDFESGPRPRPIFSMAELLSIPVSTPAQNRSTLWIYLICLGGAVVVAVYGAARFDPRQKTVVTAATEQPR